MLGANPVRELVKVPVPEPLLVLLLEMVGFRWVAQHTPLAVTGVLPDDDIFPPDMAVVCEMEPMVLVVSWGTKFNL